MSDEVVFPEMERRLQELGLRGRELGSGPWIASEQMLPGVRERLVDAKVAENNSWAMLIGIALAWTEVERQRALVALARAQFADLHSCDVCNGLFSEDEMATLGGDRQTDAGLQAYPAECQPCREGRSYRPVKCACCDITWSSHPDFLNHLAALERHKERET